MNTLILSNCPLVESQGSGYIIINTKKAFEALGYQVDMVSPEQLMILDRFKNRAKIYRLALGIALWVFRHRKKIARYNYIVFYGAEAYLAIYYLKKIYHYKGKIILHSNGIEAHVNYILAFFKKFLHLEKKWYHLDNDRLYNLSYKLSDIIFTLSKYDKDFAVNNLKIDEKKIFVNEPCLPEIFFDPAKQNPIKKNIITFCGSWIDRKGVEAIKYSIPIILNKYPGYTFRIIGVGNDFNKAGHFPEAVVNRIEVFPLVTDKGELISLYNESLIFLFPSFCESFGLVVAEALFCQCAVICGPTGIGAELINNKEAIVLQIPDNDSVLAALNTIIENPELRAKIANRGKQKVQSLNWENYNHKLYSILNQTERN